MLVADIFEDSKPEFLIFQGSKAPQLFGLNASGIPTEIVTGGNLGVGTISPGAVSLCSLGGKKELSSLAFTPIPNEEKIADAFEYIVSKLPLSH